MKKDINKEFKDIVLYHRLAEFACHRHKMMIGFKHVFNHRYVYTKKGELKRVTFNTKVVELYSLDKLLKEFKKKVKNLEGVKMFTAFFNDCYNYEKGEYNTVEELHNHISERTIYDYERMGSEVFLKVMNCITMQEESAYKPNVFLMKYFKKFEDFNYEKEYNYYLVRFQNDKKLKRQINKVKKGN